MIARLISSLRIRIEDYLIRREENALPILDPDITWEELFAIDPRLALAQHLLNADMDAYPTIPRDDYGDYPCACCTGP